MNDMSGSGPPAGHETRDGALWLCGSSACWKVLALVNTGAAAGVLTERRVVGNWDKGTD